MANKIPEEYKGKNAFQLIHTVIVHAFSLFLLPSLSQIFFALTLHTSCIFFSFLYKQLRKYYVTTILTSERKRIEEKENLVYSAICKDK